MPTSGRSGAQIRIGWVGDPAASVPAIPVDAEISNLDDGAWVITDHGRPVAHYRDEQIRISIVWKARVNSDRHRPGNATPLSPERIVEILSVDLASRGAETPASTSPLSDRAWLDAVYSTYVIPIDIGS
jgi:hypothetical protein